MDFVEQYGITEQDRLLELQEFREKWRQELLGSHSADPADKTVNSTSRVVPNANSRSRVEIVRFLGIHNWLFSTVFLCRLKKSFAKALKRNDQGDCMKL